MAVAASLPAVGESTVAARTPRLRRRGDGQATCRPHGAVGSHGRTDPHRHRRAFRRLRQPPPDGRLCQQEPDVVDTGRVVAKGQYSGLRLLSGQSRCGCGR